MHYKLDLIKTLDGPTVWEHVFRDRHTLEYLSKRHRNQISNDDIPCASSDWIDMVCSHGCEDSLVDILLNKCIESGSKIDRLPIDLRRAVNLVKFLRQVNTFKIPHHDMDHHYIDNSCFFNYIWSNKYSDFNYSLHCKIKYQNGLPCSVSIFEFVSELDDYTNYWSLINEYVDIDTQFIERWIRSRPIDLYIKTLSAADRCPYI